MRYAFFTQELQQTYEVAVLVPTIRSSEISQTYLEKGFVSTKETIVLDLHMGPTSKKKPPVSEVKEYIKDELVPTFEDLQVRYVLCAQAEYFKALTGAKKVESSLGYVMDSLYGDFKVVYVPNYRARFYDPEKFDSSLNQALQALTEYRLGCYQEPGAGIIKFEEYPKTEAEIADWLEKLLEMDCPLTIDTENFSLKHYDSDLGTISFAWNQHEGIAFAVDYQPIPDATEAPFGVSVRNEPVRNLLRSFFRRLSQKAVYHNISYDVYILVYQLFMDDLLDTEGLLEGIEIMLRNWECTKLITYHATNSCAGNKLGLKYQSQEFTGNYSEDEIKDITKIPLERLLRYNLIDALATWYVHDKHYPTMIADEQESIYRDLFQPAVKDIVQMQLTGLPLNMERVLEVKEILQTVHDHSIKEMQTNPAVVEFVDWLNRKWVHKRNSELKVKRVSLADANESFNPNSNPQLQELLFDQLKLPILSKTDSGAPSADGDTLKDLRNHTEEPVVLDLLNALVDYKAVEKILSSFIPAFENAQKASDGWHYLYGNFNLGGTLSGRLSSSDPNLQNLPSNGFMAIRDTLEKILGSKLDGYIKKGKLALGKLIKSCFEAPPGWIFCGLDFASLEDRISGLTTKDPNKLKVYVGHTVYALEIDGDIHHIRDDTTVVYNGQTMTGSQLYEELSSNSQL